MEKPKRPCKHPGCSQLVGGTYCHAHAIVHRERPNFFYADNKWRAYARAFLAKHRVCEDPEKRHPKFLVASEVVGHRVPFGSSKTLFWNPMNHMALCRGCNSVQCAKYEGGFGNPRKDPPREVCI